MTIDSNYQNTNENDETKTIISWNHRELSLKHNFLTLFFSFKVIMQHDKSGQFRVFSLVFGIFQFFLIALFYDSLPT